MPRTVSPWKIRRARALIRQRGMTLREIAESTGLSKSLVGNLATAERPRKPRLLPLLAPQTVPPYLCDCGRVVTLRPCVICAAEQKLSTKGVAAIPD